MSLYTWTKWLMRLAESAPIGGLLYIGSDHPDVLRSLAPCQADRIVMAIANPAVETACTAFAAQSEMVTFHPLAIGPPPQRLHALSTPGLSGTAEPADVLGLFPDLDVTGTYEVQSGRLADLLDALPQADGRLRILRAELSGSEAAILEELFALPWGAAPDHVFLRIPRSGLYAGQSPLPSLPDTLETSFYTLEERSDENPDFPDYWLRRDPLKGQDKVHAVDDTVRQLQYMLNLAQAKHCSTEERLSEAMRQIGELNEQLQDREEQLQLQAAQHQALRQENKAAQETALRQQTMTQNDLKDLRRRYKALLAERAAQDDLLQQVVVQLRRLLSGATDVF